MPYNFVADSFHTKKLCSRVDTVIAQDEVRLFGVTLSSDLSLD